MSSLTQWIQTTITDHGLAAVFILMVFESACVPVPSELTMIFAGFLASEHHFSVLAAVLAGTTGNLVGSWVAWYAGARGVDAVLVRGERGRHELARTQRFFDRYGNKTVFWGRMVPLVRTFVSLPAGMARVPFGRFSALTFLGCLPWCLLLTLVGYYAGSNWSSWEHRLGYLNYLMVVVLVAGGVYWYVRQRRRYATEQPVRD